jgi:hypothetical protein
MLMALSWCSGLFLRRCHILRWDWSSAAIGVSFTFSLLRIWVHAGFCVFTILWHTQRLQDLYSVCLMFWMCTHTGSRFIVSSEGVVFKRSFFPVKRKKFSLMSFFYPPTPPHPPKESKTISWTGCVTVINCLRLSVAAPAATKINIKNARKYFEKLEQQVDQRAVMGGAGTR